MVADEEPAKENESKLGLGLVAMVVGLRLGELANALVLAGTGILDAILEISRFYSMSFDLLMVPW